MTRSEKNARALTKAHERFLRDTREALDALRNWSGALSNQTRVLGSAPFDRDDSRAHGRSIVTSLRELAAAIATQADTLERSIADAESAAKRRN